MVKYGIPTALYRAFTDYDKALEYVSNWPAGKTLVIKADGLAAGKGVIICRDKIQAQEALKQMMMDKVFGAAGALVVIEEFLRGEEASVQAFVDGKNYSLMVPAQDHKRVYENDEGPNTGGMGAYAPAPVADAGVLKKVDEKIMRPFMKGIRSEA